MNTSRVLPQFGKYQRLFAAMFYSISAGLFFFPTSPAQAQSSIPSIVTAPLVEKTKAVFIPLVNLQNVPLDEALSTLAKAEAAADSQHQTVSMEVHPNNQQPLPKITLIVAQNSLPEVLDKICGSIGYSYAQEGDALVLRPGGPSNRDLETRAYRLSQAMIDNLRAKLQTSHTSNTSNDREDFLQNLLISLGVAFPPGSKLASTKDKIYVTNLPGSLDKLAVIVNTFNILEQTEKITVPEAQ